MINHQKITHYTVKFLDDLSTSNLTLSEVGILGMELVAQACLQAAYPHEKYMLVVKKIGSGFKDTWPIG